MKFRKITLDGYLNRWYILPHNNWFNIYLHQFIGSDVDRCLHDHPWWSVSFLLKGKLQELMQDTDKYILGPNMLLRSRGIRWMIPYVRSAIHRHRIILISDEAWTIFITGPKIRAWGFWPKGSWVPWKEYLGDKDDVV